MSDLRTEEVPVEETEVVPDDGEKYCHIEDGSRLRCFCGYLYMGAETCKPYEGEAFCPSCGKQNCPTCVEMASLNDRLED